jgi:hypothetical protein
MSSDNKCTALTLNGVQCTRNMSGNSECCWQHNPTDNKSTDSKLRYVYSIDIKHETSKKIKVDSHVYLWYLDKPITAASVYLGIGENDDITQYPSFPKSKIHLAGFYNYFKTVNSTYKKSDERRKELIKIYNTLSTAQKAETNGLTCALLKVTLDYLLKIKIVADKDYIFLEASGNSDSGKNDLIGLSNYYTKLGFMSDPNYLTRFKTFYSTHSDILDVNGNFTDENFIDDFINKNSEIMQEYQVAYADKSKDLNIISQKILNEYLDPFAIPMYAQISNLLKILHNKNGVCPREISQKEILIINDKK